MSYLNSIKFKAQRLLFKKITQGKFAWQIFNDAGLEGFGINLIRLYFPVYYNKKRIRDSFSANVKSHLKTIFDKAAEKYRFNPAIIESLPEILKLQVHEADQRAPYLDNYYFGVFDAAILAAMMNHFKPKKMIEIGSGISSRYINFFKQHYSLSTELTCIDPYPRAEIEGTADLIIRKPLEDVIENTGFDLQSGDIVFMDGSHYVFQGNDTLKFFFHFLPSLPTGVIIHIHDIYLPHDYEPDVAQQLWTEQYILAGMLLGGFNGYEVLYPAYHVSQTDSLLRQKLREADTFLKTKDFKLRSDHTLGFSFWMRKI